MTLNVIFIDRGFTQTFQSFESEKSKDKTKRFDVSRIVEVKQCLKNVI